MSSLQTLGPAMRWEIGTSVAMLGSQKLRESIKIQIAEVLREQAGTSCRCGDCVGRLTVRVFFQTEPQRLGQLLSKLRELYHTEVIRTVDVMFAKVVVTGDTGRFS